MANSIGLPAKNACTIAPSAVPCNNAAALASANSSSSVRRSLAAALFSSCNAAIRAGASAAPTLNPPAISANRACSRRAARTARNPQTKLHTDAALHLFRAAQQQAPNRAGGPHMRSAAGIELHPAHLHHAHRTGSFRQFAELAPRQHCLCLGAGVPARRQRTIFKNQTVHLVFNIRHLLCRGPGRAVRQGEIDRYALRAQVKRQRSRAHSLQKHRR